MPYLEFIAALTDSLAWPVAAVVIAVLFRSQLRALFPRLRALSYRDVRAEFSEGLSRAKAESDSLPEGELQEVRLQESLDVDWKTPEPTQDVPFLSPALGLSDTSLRLRINPGGIVESAWRDLLLDLETALRRQGVTVPLSEAAVGEHLVETGILPPEAAQLIERLRELRSLALTDPFSIPPEDAGGFEQITNRLRRALRAPPLPAE